MSIAVQADHLTRRFGTFTAVDDLSLSVEAGSIYGFLGPNGAGKTTTIKMLCGLERPTSGRASVAGLDVARDAEALKERIGYMSQAFSLYEELTVDQNIRFFSDVYLVPRARMAERRAFALEMSGLAGHEKRLTRTLAVGWKQRLALACAVLHEPQVLFLDEPTAGVDPIGRRRFWELIYALAAKGVTVFVTTHYMDEAENCAKVAFLRDGRLIASGDPAAMRREHDDHRLLHVQPAAGRPPDETRRALASWERVESASPFGSAIHLRTRAPMEPREVEAWLAARGLAPESVEAIRPSLEDVFLQLVEKSGGEAIAS